MRLLRGQIKARKLVGIGKCAIRFADAGAAFCRLASDLVELASKQLLELGEHLRSVVACRKKLDLRTLASG